MRSLGGLVAVVGVLAALTRLLVPSAPARVAAAEKRPDPREVFEKRILPIFKSPNPSSCTQCHLAGVDLKHYILPSSEKTFLSLRDQGLIDLDRPAESKILRLINMREAGGRGPDLIHEKTRKAEHEAFAEWIRAGCADPKLRNAPQLAKADLARPPRPAEVIRHGRKDRLLESFEQNVWAMRFRCMSCHIEGTPECARLVKEHGERVAWMKAAGPAATMEHLIAGKRLIDPKEPEKSLLLRKPLLEVKHGGGKKFLAGDQGYKAFRAWLEDYARVVRDGYATAADLPRPPGGRRRFGSDIWLKLAGTPPAWGDRLLQVNVYAWDAKAGAWEKEPIATSDRPVWGKGKLWQHNLTLAAAKDSELAKRWKAGKPALPPGRYLIKVYVDTKGRVEKDWKATLGEDDFAGQVEVESRWAAGYGGMTVVDAGKVRR
ncbi:MAG TPA: hypothetical protein VFA26_20715 [Gemmataceae bacterium]|nr:hypothetical protein [Gemmataceae bacterium]